MPELTIMQSREWFQDPVDVLLPTTGISAADVTHIIHAELQLKGMKQAVQQ